MSFKAKNFWRPSASSSCLSNIFLVVPHQLHPLQFVVGSSLSSFLKQSWEEAVF